MVRLHTVLRAGFVTIGAASVIMATMYLAVGIASKQSRASGPTNQSCKVAGHQAVHGMVIRHGIVSPGHVSAPVCDKLTITNLDTTVRLLAFGVHDEHQSYDGIGQKVLARGQSLTVTLVRPGDFRFHDHIHDQVQGTFTVVP